MPHRDAKRIKAAKFDPSPSALKRVEIPLEKRHATIAKNTREMLAVLGDDPDREGLLDTPMRHSKAMTFLTSGYETDLKKIVGKALFDAESSELVLIRDIELFSLCEHHLLPFHGKAHVAYIPTKKIVGLSKIPRIVDAFARRLQVQERLTTQIADYLVKILNPEGVAVIVDAQHMCMMMRGVEKQNSSTVTSAMRGVFKNDARSRQELLSLLGTMGPRR